MVVIRRLDAVLEPTKKAVLDMKKTLDDAKITNQRCCIGGRHPVRLSTTLRHSPFVTWEPVQKAQTL